MVLLDCGLVVEMGPAQHVNLVKVLGAFTKKDGRLAGQLMVDMGSQSQAKPQDVELFIKGIEQICIMDANQVRMSRVAFSQVVDIIVKDEISCTFRADTLSLLQSSPCVSQNFIEKVGDYISDICYLACRHHVKLESTFVNAALAVEIMEGLASALHPNIRVQSTALPLVVKAEVMHRLGIRG